MTKADKDRDTRRREYQRRTPRIVYMVPSFLGDQPYPCEGYMGQVRIDAEHDYQAQTLDLARGKVSPMRTFHASERLSVSTEGGSHSAAWPVASAKLRRMAAADARKLRTIDDRIAVLRRERYDLIRGSYDRGIVLSEAQLRAAAAKNASAEKRGYPSRPTKTEPR